SIAARNICTCRRKCSMRALDEIQKIRWTKYRIAAHLASVDIKVSENAISYLPPVTGFAMSEGACAVRRVVVVAGIIVGGCWHCREPSTRRKSFRRWQAWIV